MKRYLLLLLVLPVFATAQNKLTLTGKMKGIKEGTLVSLIDVNKPADTIAKANVKKGVFILQQELKEPMLLNLNMGPDKTLMMFLDNSSVKVSGDIAQIKNSRISGSKTQNDFLDFKKVFDPKFEKLTKINQQFQMGRRSDSLVALMDMIRDTIQKEIDHFIKKRKGSAVS
ncbi:MAG TPA: DUF4369 domain-containing protein, partial [Chitinophagaceae bacterium]|nr:DUF4369 domain-containing protein [Chitinophagaceae bacterium]